MPLRIVKRKIAFCCRHEHAGMLLSTRQYLRNFLADLQLAEQKDQNMVREVGHLRHASFSGLRAAFPFSPSLNIEPGTLKHQALERLERTDPHDERTPVSIRGTERHERLEEAPVICARSD